MSNWDFNQKTSLPSFNGSGIISGCSNLELDASNWKIPNITGVGVFAGCTALVKVDLSGWDTSKVTSASGMFVSCSNLISVDFTGWNVSNLTRTGDMFQGCSKLTTIYSDVDWDTGKVTSSERMFQACTSLVGAVPFDSSKIDITMANPTTGYFTVKPTETTE